LTGLCDDDDPSKLIRRNEFLQGECKKIEKHLGTKATQTLLKFLFEMLCGIAISLSN